MSGLIWFLFIVMLATLALSFVWFIWKLRNFNNSQNQTYIDDKLMQAMLTDEALSKKVKNALVKQAGGRAAAAEEEPEDGVSDHSTLHPPAPRS
ncbi:hypothetical protein [Candidatus Electronema sp. TJ]|uniref:hypothetical protein n=1 Tax=Candidatus Electronema sp. TJ TaxID=3401573 RepID=UPI003AA87CEA